MSNKKLTEEHKKNISIIMKGKKTGRIPKTAFKKGYHSPTEFKKGNPIGRKFKNGQTPYKMTDEIRMKMSLAKRGKKSPNWKGGISQSRPRNFEYRLWRRKIFIRDKFTCVECNQVGGQLEVHHIKSYTHYPELRFDMNNGITLCINCHKLTNNYKGKSKKNVNQII